MINLNYRQNLITFVLLVVVGVLVANSCSTIEKAKESINKQYTGGPWAIEVYPEKEQIYWLRSHWDDTNSQELFVTSYDGEETKMLVGPSSPDEEVDVLDFTLDKEREYIYWSTAEGKIKRAQIDGSKEEVVMDNIPHPTRIALDEKNGIIYWMTPKRLPSFYKRSIFATEGDKVENHGLLRKAKIDLDSNSTQEIVRDRETIENVGYVRAQTLLGLLELEVDDQTGELFYSKNGKYGPITYHRFSEGREHAVFSPGGMFSGVNIRSGLGLYEEKKEIFHANKIDNQIVRISYKTKSNPEPFIEDVQDPTDVAIDKSEEKIYWTEYAQPTLGSSLNNRITGIYRANLDGSNRELVLADSLVDDS